MTNEEGSTSCDEPKAPARSSAVVPADPIEEEVRLLLAEGRVEEVVALVAKLTASNGALLRMLETHSARGHKNSEIVSPAQLALLLSGLAKLEEQARPEDLSKVDDDLREKANIDALTAEDKDKDAKKKDRKHSPRRPFPDKLRRVDLPDPARREAQRAPRSSSSTEPSATR